MSDADAQGSKSAKQPNKIAWAQGGLSGLHRGIKKSEAERALGCELKLYDSGSAGEQYTCSLSTTWLNNIRITFARNEIIEPCSLDFLNNKLRGIVFVAYRGWEKNFMKTVLSTFGEGAPASNYYYGGDYIWFDYETMMICGKDGLCSIIDWRAADRLRGDYSYKESYNKYISWWQRKHF